MSAPTPQHDRVLKILSDVSAVPPADIKTTDLLTADLGMDSVGLMELLGMLDEAFGMEIELEQAQQIETVGAILKLVDEHVDA